MCIRDSYNDFAILYRSNYISRVFEQRLLQANIDYQIVGGQKFFERKEIKDVLAYLQLVVHEDDLSLSRIINVPKGYVSKITSKQDENNITFTIMNTYKKDDSKLPETGQNILYFSIILITISASGLVVRKYLK